MFYCQLGRTGLKVSEIGLGTMMFGEKTGEYESIRIVHQALEAGINLIDVADIYAGGESERIVGKALKGRRSEAILATKGGRATPLGEGLSPTYVFRAVEASLKRLQTDYIDLYQVHRWDPATPLEDTLEALDNLVKQGKVRNIGCSNFTAGQLNQASSVSTDRGWSRFESIQPRYNLVYREAEAQLLPHCLAEEIGVLAYSPLAGGVLTGKYQDDIPEGSRAWKNPTWQQNRLTPVARTCAQRILQAATRLGRPAGQVAIRWCLAHPAVSTALVGPRTEEQWAEAVEAGTWKLSSNEASQISQD